MATCPGRGSNPGRHARFGRFAKPSARSAGGRVLSNSNCRFAKAELSSRQRAARPNWSRITGGKRWQAQRHGGYLRLLRWPRPHLDAAAIEEASYRGFLPDTISSELTLTIATNGPVQNLNAKMSSLLWCRDWTLRSRAARNCHSGARLFAEMASIPAQQCDKTALHLDAVGAENTRFVRLVGGFERN